MADKFDGDASRLRIARVLETIGLGGTTVRSVTALSGGCTGEAMRVEIRTADDSSETLFAKRQDSSFASNFSCELDGLKQLARAGEIDVATPVGTVVDQESAWLVTKWVDTETANSEFQTRFGRSLGLLHRRTCGDQIGLDYDNYLGSARQPNTPAAEWTEFFATRRLGHQIRWAVDQGYATRRLCESVDRLIDRLPNVLEGRADETCLLHGDLWSGNYMSAVGGRPLLIDPAIYYGCREAEFGMVSLFGGCSPEFYEAYQAEWPLASGWQRRVKVYVLYHLLNHLNLFGRGYLAQCESVADQSPQD